MYNKLQPQTEQLKVTSERLARIRQEVADIDALLSFELPIKPLTKEEREELLDRREGLRLEALADVMTRSTLDPIQPLDERLLCFLVPSKHGRLQYYAEHPPEGVQKGSVQLALKVIDTDRASHTMHALFKSAGGDADKIQCWVDRATEIKPCLAP